MPGFLLMLSVDAYLFGFGVLAAFLAASVLHELGHLAAARAMGVRVCCLRLTALGGELCLEGDSETAYWQDAILALSGPGVNLVTAAVLLMLLPETPGRAGAYLLSASFLLCAFNLVPVPPLDGGAALYALGAMLLPPAIVQRGVRWISGCAVLTVVAAGMWIARAEEHNLSLLLLGVWLAASFVRRGS